MWLGKNRSRIFMAAVPADLRRSYDGLGALVEKAVEGGAMSGDIFVFLNKRRTQVRMFFWDGSGYCIFMKRLEAGTFRHVFDDRGDEHIEIDAAELAMLLDGIDAKEITKRKRYDRMGPRPSNVKPARKKKLAS